MKMNLRLCNVTGPLLNFDAIYTRTNTFVEMAGSGITYVAVHGGAGIHNHSSDRQVKQALRR